MGTDMPPPTRNRKFARAALCAAFGIFLVIGGGVGMAYAVDDEDDNLPPDEKFIRGLLRGLGLRNGQEAGIEYKERPPLVVPPSRDLPRPATTGSITATNPAWPADPDEKRRIAERKARAERKPYDPFKAGERLSPSELAAGRTDKPSAPAPPGGPDYSPEMTPSQLGYTGGIWSFKNFGFGGDNTETGRFSREPPRSALTDPPVGYRTPSPAQPYGLNGKAEKARTRPAADPQIDTVNQ